MSALIQNFDTVEKVIETSAKSAGSALKENERYLDSIQGRIDQFNNSVQAMWSNALDSDVVKGVVEFGTELVKIIDSLGLVKTLVMVIGTYLIKKNFKGDLFGGIFNAKSIDDAKAHLQSLKSEYEKAQKAYDANHTKANKKYLDKTKGKYEKYDAKVSPHVQEYDDINKKLKEAQDNLAKYQKKRDGYRGKSDKVRAKNQADVNKAQKEVDKLNKKLKDSELKIQKNGIAGTKAGKKIKAGFKAGAKAVRTFAKQIAKSMLTMYAITTALELLGKLGEWVVNVFDGFYDSPEELQDKFEELNNELSDTKSELNRLEDELENTNERIEELMEQGTLTFVEQEELSKLKETSAELERQIALQDTLRKSQQQGVNAASINATDAYLGTSFMSDKTRTERREEAKETGKTWGQAAGIAIGIGIAALLAPFTGGLSLSTIAVGAGGGALVGGGVGGIIGSSAAGSSYDSEQTVAEAMDSMLETRKKLKEEQSATLAANDAEAYNEATEALRTYDAQMAKHISQIQQNYNAMDWEVADPETRKQMIEYADWLDKYNISMGTVGAKSNAIARIFGEEASDQLKEIKKRMEEAAKTGKEISLADAFNGDEEAYNAFKTRLYDIGLTVYEIEQYFKDQKKAADDAINSIETYDAIKQIQKLTSGVNDLKNAFRELHEEGLVSAETLLGLEDIFGDTEGWDEFFETMSSGTATMKEAEESAKTLAENYVDGLLSSGKYSAKEYVTYISHLQSLGITNSKDFLDAKLKKNMVLDIAQKIKTTGMSPDLAVKIIEEEYGIKLDGENDVLLVQKAITAEKKKQEASDKQAAKNAYDSAVINHNVAKEKNQAIDDEINSLSSKSISDLQKSYGVGQIGYTSGQVPRPYVRYNDKTYYLPYDGSPTKELTDAIAANLANKKIEVPSIPAEVTEIDVTNANNAATEASNDLQAELDKHGLAVEINLIDKNELIDEAQSIYDTLVNAAKEYGESGYVSVDTLQSLLQLEPKYLALLYDENGQLNLNKDTMYQLTVARVTDMGVQQAQQVIETARTALLDGNISKLRELTEVTYDQADANWNLVTSNLALLKTEMEDAGVDDGIYQGIEDQVFAIQNLTNTTIANIGNTISSSGNTAAAEVEDAFGKLMDYYDNRISANQAKYDQIQNDIEWLEQQGKMADANYYKDQIALLNEGEESKEAFLEAKLQGAADRLRELEAAGQEGSDEWWEAAQIYNDTLSELDDVRDTVLDLQDAIGNIEWSQFEEFNSRLDDINNKLETMRDLIAPNGEEDWFDDEGNWTEKGVAVLGSQIQSLEYYKNGLNEASDALAEFQSKQYEGNEDWFANNYGIHSEQEYTEYLQKLTNEQYDYAKSVSSSEQAIADMYKSNIDAIEEYTGKLVESYNDYIDNVKEALDAERDLYNFKKNVEKQTKNIATLERRIASLSGSTNASDIATRRKLEQELYDSRESLNDTYYEHSMDSRQEALDKESKAYEEAMNRFVENLHTNLDIALTDMDGFIAGVTSAVTANAPLILDEYGKLGIALDDAIVSPWQAAQDAMSGYTKEDGLGLMNSWTANGGVFSTFSLKATNYLTSIWSNTNVDPNNVFENAVVSKVSGIKESIRKNVETAKEYLQDLYDVQDTSVYNSGGGGGGGGYVPQGSPQPAYSKQVENLQKILNKFFGTNITANGIFDDATREAVKKMQKKIGVLNNGVYNKQTYEALMAYLNKQPVGSWFRQVGFGIPGPMPQYAKGTTGTTRDEWAITDEHKFGDELVLVPGKDGNLSFMRKGTGVVPADLTQKLFELAQIPTSDLMNKNLTAIVPNITKNDIKNEFNFDSLVHVDHCDQGTLKDLEKMVDNKIDKFSKDLNYSLKKFAR